MSGAISRRRVLGLAGALGVAGVSLGVGLTRRSELEWPAVSDGFVDPLPVAALGEGWLAAASQDAELRWSVPASMAAVQDTLRVALQLDAFGPRPTTRDVLVSVQVRSRQEHADGQTVEVDGWLLTPSQIHLAALVAFEQRA